uniref:Uncharacterized protein n=1 Tax=Setaria italica TaxID=4555 RepID=K4A493_SETIT
MDMLNLSPLACSGALFIKLNCCLLLASKITAIQILMLMLRNYVHS